MLIGVRFCGGCNPKYDRKAYLDKIVRENSSHQFEIAQEGETFHTLLVIGGCSSCCAEYEQYKFDRMIKIWEETHTLKLDI